MAFSLQAIDDYQVEDYRLSASMNGVREEKGLVGPHLCWELPGQRGAAAACASALSVLAGRMPLLSSRQGVGLSALAAASNLASMALLLFGVALHRSTLTCLLPPRMGRERC